MGKGAIAAVQGTGATRPARKKLRLEEEKGTCEPKGKHVSSNMT